MKKKFPKYQTGSPCGEGTQWDPLLKQCVPISQIDPVFNNNLWANPAQQVIGNPYGLPPTMNTTGDPVKNFNINPTTNNKGVVKQSDVVPVFRGYDGEILNDISAGRHDADGNFVPQRQVIGDALDKGFNYDSDGVYRKTQITTDPNRLDIPDEFKALNTGLDVAKFIGGTLNDARNSRKERLKYLEAIQQDPRYNQYEKGLNNVPVYFQNGGKFPYGGGPLTAEGAKEILRDGKIRGKKLTEKQKRYFGYIAGGGEPKQDGGYVNDTGYTPGTETFNNPYNIIPSNNITMENTPFEVMGYPNVGKPVLMQPGEKYIFPGADQVTEVPMQNGGRKVSKVPAGYVPIEGKPNYYHNPQSSESSTRNKGTKMSDKKWLEFLNSPEGKAFQEKQSQSTNDTVYIEPPKPVPVSSFKGQLIYGLDNKPVGMYRFKQRQSADGATQAGAVDNPDVEWVDVDQNGNPKGDPFIINGSDFSNKVVKGTNRLHGKDVLDTYRTKMQTGGSKPPIYTNDKNKIKAYNDSLNLYNKAKLYKNNYDIFAKKNNVKTWSDASNAYEAGQNIQPILQQGFIWPESQNNQVLTNDKRLVKISDEEKKKIFPQDMPYLHTYKKPIQPYKYKDDPTIKPNKFQEQQLIDYTQSNPRLAQRQAGSVELGSIPQVPYQVDYYQNNELQSKGFMNSEEGAQFMKELDAATGLPEYKNRGDYRVSGYYNKKMQTGGQDNYNAELEQGEVFQTQQGEITKVPESEPRHEQGGSLQANVERVLEDTSDKRKDKDSKYLLISKEEAEQLTGLKLKRNVSHSKLYEKAKLENDKKVKKFENKLKSNVEYVDKGGGEFAQNSLDLNIKKMDDFKTNGDIFDIIYSHQEQVKQKYQIDQEKQAMKKGGKKELPVYQNGTSGLVPWPGDKYKNKKNASKYTAEQWAEKLKERGYKGDFNNLDVQKFLYSIPQGKEIIDKLHTTRPGTIYGDPAQGRFDAKLGYRWDEALDAIPTPQKAVEELPVTPEPTLNLNDPYVDNTKYNFDKTNGADSKFYESLEWYDTMPHVLNYLSSLERTPVDLEQLQYDPLKVHEETALPVIMQNQGDFNAALQMLPSSGVGYANQANLQNNKYAVNQQAIAGVESRNKAKFDQVDAINNQGRGQIDATNMQLRDQFNQRILQGKEVQRLSKLNAFNDYATMVAQNRKLNREGNLVLELTPYFDQYGRFNGKKYVTDANIMEQEKGTGYTNSIEQISGKRYTVRKNAKGEVVSRTEITNTKPLSPVVVK